MKIKVLTISILILLSVFLNSCSEDKQSDRSALVALMEQYLDALVNHDPSLVPLASDVKLVENTKVTPIGEGLWETITSGPNTRKIFVADPVKGQVAFMGVIEENNKPTILGARLKVVDRKIAEIDHLTVEPLVMNMTQARAGLITPIDPSERISREEMIRIANSYYEAVVNDNGELCPFADESQRRENGKITANHQAQTPAEAEVDDFSVFRQMKCSDQLSTGVMSYITDINRRRFIAVDEEMGLVFVYSMFIHSGEPKIMKITGAPGVTERANNYGSFDLPAAHVFKIRNGKMYEIEAMGYIAEHGIKNGWEM